MTDHVGDTTQMVPMTQQRLDAIKARCEAARDRPAWGDCEPIWAAIIGRR